MPDSIMITGATMARPTSSPDPAKAERMRRWACKIASDLPSDQVDALAVLKLAERLILWTGTDKMPRPEGENSAQ